MPDIFLSFAHEDRERVRPLVPALEAKGWAVFWDQTIPPGVTWRAFLGEALERSRCVVVVWSRASLTSDWVLEEADYGKRKGNLVPLRLDPIDPPFGFGEIQVADLSDWRGSADHLGFGRLTASIQNTLSDTQSPQEGLLDRPKIVTSKLRDRSAKSLVAYSLLVISVGLAMYLAVQGIARRPQAPAAKPTEVMPADSGRAMAAKPSVP
ncbi:MAG TPA: toll/interleukin-1 receptor domain-containing protein, partial [Candidatus Dormibacteraeota bacterium]|nr:toll/interleukin-1 receptor domain-containing protein [Candidatus Dormibacteraeota bacterium]